MVKELVFQLKNPFFISALTVLLLVYTGLVPLKKNSLVSLVPESELCEIRGTVCSNPSKTSSGKYYSMEIKGTEVKGTVKGARQTAFRLSSSCYGKIKVLVPAVLVEALYPGKLYSAAFGDRNCILYEKNSSFVFYGKILSKSGYSSSGYSLKGYSSKDSIFLAESTLPLSPEDSPSGNKGLWIRKVYSFRSALRLCFKRLMYSWGNAGALVLSLLSGSREYLEEIVAGNFKKAGLSHILALSGMHLSFFSGLSSKVSAAVFGKKRTFLFSLISVLLFVLFAGLTPSLLRALISCIILLSCKKLNLKEVDQLSVLSFAFLLQGSLRPDDFFNTAFILSYGALAGILLFSADADNFLCSFIPPELSSGLSASISAQAVTMPVSISLFGEIMPVGIIASVFVSPLVSFFMTAAVISICICLVLPFLSPLFSYIMNGIYAVIALVLNFFASAPSVTFT